jgi:hypothetical protein
MAPKYFIKKCSELTTIGENKHNHLLDRISELEAEIAEWRTAAGEWNCSSPEELRYRIVSLPST